MNSALAPEAASSAKYCLKNVASKVAPSGSETTFVYRILSSLWDNHVI
jgi:hypothetical protein